MIYKIRPGIVRLKICDVDILAATREVWENCPTIRPLPRLWACCWAIMEKGSTSADVIRTFAKLFGQSEDEARQRLDKIFSELYKQGYLIPVHVDASDE